MKEKPLSDEITVNDIEGMSVEEMAQTAEGLVEQIRTLQALSVRVHAERLDNPGTSVPKGENDGR